VREKRSGLLYVRKTFYSRQTSGNHIIRHLFDLIARQDSPDASSNVIRCYGAYLDVENDGVRGIFEFCEGGSLYSISNVITQRGAIVGEKIAGRIASGVRESVVNLYFKSLILTTFADAPGSQFLAWFEHGPFQCQT
jgi:mitogen-activated protein kinase kinase